MRNLRPSPSPHAAALHRGLDKVERARLVKAPEEHLYGFQIATKVISEGVAASKLAGEHGARWIDLNCG